MKSDDQLSVESGEVRKVASELGIEVVEGWVECDRTTKINCTDISPDEFVRQAHRLGGRVLVLELATLDQEDVDQAKEIVSEATASDTREVGKIVEECEDKIGHIASIELTYFLPGSPVAVACSTLAEWYDAIFNTRGCLGIEEEEQPRKRKLTDQELEEMARRLAAHPPFQNARNTEARKLEARKLLIPELEKIGCPWQLRDIVPTAKSIYETEILPQRDEAVRKQVEELAAQGLKRSEIARRLQLPQSQVMKFV